MATGEPAGSNQSGTGRPGTDRTGTDQSGAGQPRAGQPRADQPGAVADRIADEIFRPGGPARRQLADVLHQLGAIDRAVYEAVAEVPAPALDRAMRRLSRSANHSALWLGIAAALAASGPHGRRAAARGVLAIGVTSAAVNVGVKSLARRRRPDRAGAGVPDQRHVTMPSSTSFPSGHSASAFAFATAISRDSPWLAIGIQFVAGAVAYSRVHTGVHYPGDTIVGALIGAGAGQAVNSVLDRAIARRDDRDR